MSTKNTNRLRELREEKGLKQSELADEIGTSQQYISKYERNDFTAIDPSLEEAIADYFSCSIDYLRGKSSIRNPEEYFSEAILLKTEFQKLGIIGKDEDISDDLLAFFRTFLEANKPFIKEFSKLKEKNMNEDSTTQNNDVSN